MTSTVPALQIFTADGDVELRVTVDDETHTAVITPREAYTLATFVDWLYDEDEPDMPSTFVNLPDNVAVDLGWEPCPTCAHSHDRPVLYVSVSVGEGLEDVRVVELRHSADFRSLPYFLNFAAANAAS